MNRRALLRGFLALPVVAALAPLLPKSVAPKVITSPMFVAPIREPRRFLTGLTWFNHTDAVATLVTKVNGVPVQQFMATSGYSTSVRFDYPFLLASGDKLSFEMNGAPYTPYTQNTTAPPLVQACVEYA